jgi:hypothetical protein
MVSHLETLIADWHAYAMVKAQEYRAGAALRMTFVFIIAAQAAYLSALFGYYVWIKTRFERNVVISPHAPLPCFGE